MNTIEQEHALAEYAEREDREARAELVQVQAKRTREGLAQATADARFTEARRQHPYLSPDQIAAMLDREPAQYVNAVHIHAVQS